MADKPRSPSPSSPPARRTDDEREGRSWPLSWVLIAILIYAALQMAYFLFFGA